MLKNNPKEVVSPTAAWMWMTLTRDNLPRYHYWHSVLRILRRKGRIVLTQRQLCILEVLQRRGPLSRNALEDALHRDYGYVDMFYWTARPLEKLLVFRLIDKDWSRRRNPYFLVEGNVKRALGRALEALQVQRLISTHSEPLPRRVREARVDEVNLTYLEHFLKTIW